jgi:hypothetical protein
MIKIQDSEGVLDLSCQWCGCDMSDNPKHQEWCKKGPRYIYDMFQGLFRDTYNVIELSEDSAKAEKMKDLIGNRIMELRNSLTFGIAKYLREKLA